MRTNRAWSLTAVAMSLTAAIVVLFASAAAAADGARDGTYGTGGVASVPVPPSWAEAQAAAIDSADRTVLVGRAGGRGWPIVRLTTAGAPDPAFDGDGIRRFDVGNGGQADAVKVLSDGRILVGGDASGDGSVSRPYLPRFALVRLHDDGAFDESFGDRGTVLTPVGGDPNATGVGGGVTALAVQPDGRIIAAGYAFWNGMSRFVVARYSADGELDSSFDDDGLMDVNFYPGGGTPSAVVVEPGGKIVVAGTAYSATDDTNVSTLARLTSSGSLDSTFGSGGIVQTQPAGAEESAAEDVLLQPDGKLVTAGWRTDSTFHSVFVASRYETDGDLDPGFGPGGIVETQFNAKDAAGAYAVHLQNDGKLVLAGRSEDDDSVREVTALVRYTAAGSVDTTFGTNGRASGGLPGSSSAATAIVGQSDGKLVAAGYGDDQFLAERYTAGPPPPPPPAPPENPPPPAPTPGCQTASVKIGSDFEAHASCFRQEGQTWVASGFVRFNGVDLRTIGDGVVVVDPTRPRISTRGEIELKIGTITLYRGPIDFDPRSRLHLSVAGQAMLGPFPLRGQASFDFAGGRAVVGLQATYLTIFASPSASVRAVTIGSQGLALDSLRISVPAVAVPPFSISATELVYGGASGWHATGHLRLLTLNTTAALDGDLTVTNAGRMRFDITLSGSQRLGLGRIEVKNARLALTDRPVSFSGTVSASTAGGLTLDGNLFYRPATVPYFEVQGTASLFGRQLANASLTAWANGSSRMRGSLDFALTPASTVPYLGKVDGVRVRGTVDGYFLPGNGFVAKASGTLGLSWVTLPSSVYLIPGKLGACSTFIVDPPVFSPFSVDFGLTYTMGGAGGVQFGIGCGWTGFDQLPAPPTGSFFGTETSGSSSASYRMQVAAKTRAITIAATGRQAAPALTLSGPNGRRLVIPRKRGVSRGAGYVALRDARTTYVIIGRPAGGMWSVAPLGATSDIVSLRRAEALPEPSVRARISGKQRARRLSWRLRPIAGQRVTFVEEGKNVRRVLVATRRARGVLRFTPTAGAAGRRTIVAWVQQGGTLRKRLVVARYTAPGLKRLSKPARLRAHRRGTSITVAWRRVAGASRYVLTARLPQARRLVVTTARSAVTLPNARGPAVITVRAVDAFSRRGPAASVRAR